MRFLRKLLAGKGNKRNPRPTSAASATTLVPERTRDRRLTPRNAVQLQASMAAGLSGIPEPAAVRDFNEQGVYLFANYPVGIGAEIDLFFTLPAEVTGSVPRRVHYVAAVRRVEEQNADGKFGIAAVIKHCNVQPEETPKVEPAPLKMRRNSSITKKSSLARQSFEKSGLVHSHRD